MQEEEENEEENEEEIEKEEKKEEDISFLRREQNTEGKEDERTDVYFDSLARSLEGENIAVLSFDFSSFSFIAILFMQCLCQVMRKNHDDDCDDDLMLDA